MREKVNAALREAAKGDDRTRAAVLRLVLTALRDRQRGDLSEEPDPEVENAMLREIMATMVRQRRAQAQAYEEAGRLDMAANEEAEIAVLQEFLPRPLAPQDEEAEIGRAIRDAKAQSIRDLGRVVALLRSRHEGVMDFAQIGKRVAARLRAGARG
jgi:uncharacterized protein YqeY